MVVVENKLEDSDLRRRVGFRATLSCLPTKPRLSLLHPAVLISLARTGGPAVSPMLDIGGAASPAGSRSTGRLVLALARHHPPLLRGSGSCHGGNHLHIADEHETGRELAPALSRSEYDF
jgi:hypothetical protein